MQVDSLQVSILLLTLLGSLKADLGGAQLVLAEIEVSWQSWVPAIVEVEGSVLNACLECIVDSKLVRGQQVIPSCSALG